MHAYENTQEHKYTTSTRDTTRTHKTYNIIPRKTAHAVCQHNASFLTCTTQAHKAQSTQSTRRTNTCQACQAFCLRVSYTNAPTHTTTTQHSYKQKPTCSMLSPASSISKYKYTYAYTHAHNNTQQLQLRASTYAQKANVFGVLAREQVKIIAIDAARGVLVYDSKILEA